MEYLVPKLLFGCGIRSKLAEEARPFGTRAAFFDSPSLKRSGESEKLALQLKSTGISVLESPVRLSGEPTDADADAAAAFVRDARAQMVIAVGGGGVLDLGKAAAALAPQKTGKAADYAEGVGSMTLCRPPLPFLALPTTSGTGSEMTKNSVLRIEGYGKRSIRADSMLAKAALVDPELTLSLPRAVTAASGADALCQLIESYTTKNATPYTDGIALAHIRTTAEALPRAYRCPDDLSAREALSAGAAMSGICLANAGLGIAHGIAGILGGFCGIPHGICCGILLPYAIFENAKKGVEKYLPIARELGYSGSDAAAAGEYLSDYIFRLNEEIGIPKDLRSFGIDPGILPEIAAQCASSSGTRKNPVPFSAAEILTLLERLAAPCRP